MTKYTSENAFYYNSFIGLSIPYSILSGESLNLYDDDKDPDDDLVADTAAQLKNTKDFSAMSFIEQLYQNRIIEKRIVAIDAKCN